MSLITAPRGPRNYRTFNLVLAQRGSNRDVAERYINYLFSRNSHVD